MSIASDISDLKDLSDGVVANKVSRFAYTEQAYTDNEVNGVIDYDVNRGRNIPVGTASVMRVNQTVIEKGWRARASSITRMLMNHFLGRISYNLNKVNDWFNSFLGSMASYLGAPNGIATLDADGHLTQQEPLGSPYLPVTKPFLSAVFARLLCRNWRKGAGIVNSVNEIAFADGLWVCASGYYGCWWSANGKSWTQGTGANTSYKMWEFTYANGLWVCGSNYHGCWWSEDGKAWTQGTGTNTEENMYKAIFANGIWVCSSDKGCWWSADGKSWTQGTGANTSYKMLYLTYANNIWVCYADNDNGMWWSEDGKTWTQGTGGGTSQTTMCVLYANGLWVAGGYGRYLKWSTDGKNWTVLDNSGLSAVLCLVYANGLWVAGTSGGGAFWSTDGKNWTQGSGISDQSDMSVAYANGHWVCMGEFNYGGKVWWSGDGKNWTQGTGAQTLQLYNLMCVNGIWFACRDGVWRSEDGKSWAKSGGGLDNISINHLVYANGMFVCGTEGNGAWYSAIDDLIADGTIDLGADVPLVNV